MTALTVVAAVGSSVVGGVFLAFSVLVMKALRRLPPGQGIAAMQAVNVAAPAPLFMATLFGTALACAGLIVVSIGRSDGAAVACQLVGSALYLSAVVLTIVYHVPRNLALAAVDPNDAGAAVTWRRYLSGWTAWNHVRTATSVAAAVTLTVALRLG